MMSVDSDFVEDERYRSQRVFNLTVEQYKKVMTAEKLEHYFENINVDNVCAENEVHFPTPHGNFWDPLCQLHEGEGPRLPSEILMTYFGVEDEYIETYVDEITEGV